MADGKLSEFPAAKQLSIYKKRIGGLRAPVNERIRAAQRLAAQAIGPPVLSTPIISDQLNIKLKGIDEAYAKLEANIDSILDIVEADDDTTEFDYYTDYIAKCDKQREECREAVTNALIAVSAPIAAPIAEGDLDESDSDGGATTRRKAARPRAVSELKPEKLKSNAKAAEFQVWKRRLMAYWNASNFALYDTNTQQQCLEQRVETRLMGLIRPSMKADMPVLPIDGHPELGSVMALLSDECEAKNPVVSRRYELFRTEHTTWTLTEYISQLRIAANHAEMEDLQAKISFAYMR